MFFKNHLLSSAAEMAYFLVFAFFPLLMVIHASFSMVLQNFDIKNTFFYNLLPDVIENLLDSYIEHISSHSNLSFLLLGIILTVYTLSNVMKSMKRAVRKVYKSSSSLTPFAEIIFSIIFSVLILAAFFGSLILLVLGGYILEFLNKIIPIFDNVLIQSILGLVFTTLIIFAVVSLLYFWLPNKKLKYSDIFPGAIIGTAGWIMVSLLFSFYMNNFSSYSLIYGSIGAFIILLLWIYISCIVLLLGAVVNAVIYSEKIQNRNMRKDKKCQ